MDGMDRWVLGGWVDRYVQFYEVFKNLCVFSRTNVWAPMKLHWWRVPCQLVHVGCWSQVSYDFANLFHSICSIWDKKSSFYQKVVNGETCFLKTSRDNSLYVVPCTFIKRMSKYYLNQKWLSHQLQNTLSDWVRTRQVFKLPWLYFYQTFTVVKNKCLWNDFKFQCKVSTVLVAIWCRIPTPPPLKFL